MQVNMRIRKPRSTAEKAVTAEVKHHYDLLKLLLQSSLCTGSEEKGLLAFAWTLLKQMLTKK